MAEIRIETVTSENVGELGLYCIKDKKAPGYQKKLQWFQHEIKNGLRICIAKNPDDEQLGFIEYIPSELAWRPVRADNYFFVQCIMVYGKKVRNQDIGSALIRHCEEEAKAEGKHGICAMTSKGSWIATKQIFEKNGFSQCDKRGRFELMFKPINEKSDPPQLNNWNEQQKKYQGWNLLYADQCPWHIKSATDLQNAATKHGIDLNVIQIASPIEAQEGPSGYGTYALIKDGKLLEDHYISKTRFENILKKELS